MRRLPPLNALRAFEATARLASVTAAARELGVTHSAVSQQLKQLEGYLGQKLFDRPGRRVEPTASARAFLNDIQPALDQIAIAAEQLTRRGVRRILTVSAPPTFASRWLIPRIDAFQRAHPGLEVRVTTSVASGMEHADRQHDVVIRRGTMSRRGHACRRLLDDISTPVMHPRLAARGQTLPSDITRVPLLHTRAHPEAWRDWLHTYAALRSETLDGAFFDNTSLAIGAALHGLGATMAPLVLVEDLLRDGQLVAPFAELTISGAGFHMLYREAAAEERGVRELIRWMSKEASGGVMAHEPRRAAGSEKSGAEQRRPQLS